MKQRFAVFLIVLLAVMLGSTHAATATSPGDQATNFAGNGTRGDGGDGGPATVAQINKPRYLVGDDVGNFYFVDEGNYRIRRVDPNGTITTVAGTGIIGTAPGTEGAIAINERLSSINGLAIDADGDLYFAQDRQIRKITDNGTITRIAGLVSPGFSGDGGPALNAEFDRLDDIAFDDNNNLYISDSGNNRIRMINNAGVISTIAGDGREGSFGDGGPATTAAVGSPEGLAFDSSGNLYIVNERQVRMVNPAGIISTVAGGAPAREPWIPEPEIEGAVATSVRLTPRLAIALSNTDELYVLDANKGRVYRVDRAGLIRTVAGGGRSAPYANAIRADTLQFYNPTSVAFDTTGNLYITEETQARIVKVTLDESPPHAAITSPVTGSIILSPVAVQFSCGDTGASGLASCAATLNNQPIGNGASVNMEFAGPNVLTVTALDEAGNRAVQTTSFTVGRQIVSLMSSEDIYNISTAAQYLNMSSERFQRTGVAVLRFINALGKRSGTSPLGADAPRSVGTDTLSSYWLPAEENTLRWITSYYVIPEDVGQKVGSILLYFLASVDARAKGTPLPQFVP